MTYYANLSTRIEEDRKQFLDSLTDDQCRMLGNLQVSRRDSLSQDSDHAESDACDFAGTDLDQYGPPARPDCAALAIPAGLSPEGKAAAVVIATELKKAKGSTGGCRAFYTPEEWAERGEQYGLNAELIVCHDGGDLAPMFNLDYMQYETYDKAAQALSKVGVWPEGCTSWYTAIYKS